MCDQELRGFIVDERRVNISGGRGGGVENM